MQIQKIKTMIMYSLSWFTDPRPNFGLRGGLKSQKHCCANGWQECSAFDWVTLAGEPADP